MPRRIRAGGLAVAALLLGGCGSGSTATPQPAPVAQVGKTAITQAAFDTRLQSTLTAIHQGGAPAGDTTMETQVRARVLRGLILDTIIAQEAATFGVAATDAEVQSEIDRDARSAGGLTALQSQLASAGGSVAQLKDEIRSTLNEQRVEEHFAQQRAGDVEQQLASGTGFEATAMQWSDDTGSSGKGGDLGALTADELKTYDAAFAAAVAGLAPGQYTKTPVHDAGGYDIVMVYAVSATSRSVKHILVSAPVPYTVTNRPSWFSAALFSTVAQYCQQNQIHVYVSDAGANPCNGAPTLAPTSTPSQ
jgi:parvulin-like peptidyl-prolyl isomerase